jgi:hypothetical protein
VGKGCFALATSEERSPDKGGRHQLGLPKKGLPAGPLARATALLAQERREKTLRALEYIKKHQYLYHDGQVTSMQKYFKGAAAKAGLSPTPNKAERSGRKPGAATQA